MPKVNTEELEELLVEENEEYVTDQIHFKRLERKRKKERDIDIRAKRRFKEAD